MREVQGVVLCRLWVIVRSRKRPDGRCGTPVSSPQSLIPIFILMLPTVSVAWPRAPAAGHPKVPSTASAGCPWPRCRGSWPVAGRPTFRPRPAHHRRWWPSGRQPASPGRSPTVRHQGNHQRFQQERHEDLPAGVAQQPQHADVLGSLADGGKHGVHHAEHAADGHHHRQKADGIGELGVGFG